MIERCRPGTAAHPGDLPMINPALLFRSRATRVASAALLALAGAAATAPAHAQVELSFSAWVPASHMLVRDGMQPWMDEVAKVTDGRVKIKLLPKPVTNAVNHFDAVRDGLADAAFISHSYTPARFPMIRVGMLPFSGDSAEANSVALWRTYTKHFGKLDEHKGVKLITVYTHGPGIFWNAKLPIQTVEDFAGLKIRVGGGMAADVANALGVNAVFKPAPESYEMLSSGVVDGVMFPGESINSFKLDKLVKYATEFPGGLYSDSHAVIMNTDRWNKIAKADQDAITAISGEVLSRNIGKAWDTNGTAGIQSFKAAGGQVVPASESLVKGVTQKTAQFETDWIKLATEKGFDGKAIVAEYRAELKKLGSAK